MFSNVFKFQNLILNSIEEDDNISYYFLYE